MTQTNNLTLLGFDFGTKQIGVAVGQTLTNTAKPLGLVNAKDGIPNWQQLQAIIQQWQPDGFVVGIPYNMDDSESEMSLRAKKFANRLHGRYGKPSYHQDERLSTREAKQRLSQDPEYESWKKFPLDSVAAALILQDWLQNNG